MHQHEIDPATPNKPFESDSQKIVRKHLEDKNHVITEEEIRNVRVGVTPQLNVEPSLQHDVDELRSKKDEASPDVPISSWDTLEK